MNRIVIGIDPGLSGAVAFVPVDRRHEAWVVDMPTVKVSSKGFVKNAIDGTALADVLRMRVTDLTVDLPLVEAYVERVGPFPGQGVASMFSLGMSYWGAVCSLAALRIPTTLVEPKDWKAYFRLEKDKELARGLATRLFPHIDLRHKKDHGRAEALLIALYGWTIKHR